MEAGRFYFQEKGARAMNQYLTEKALRKHPLDIPIAVICGIFLAALAASAGETITGKDLAVSLIALAILVALFGGPIVRIVCRRLRVRDARTLARCFETRTDPELPLSDLAAQVRFRDPAARVEKLINTVAHDNFGALVDLGNFMCADEDPTLSVAIMAPYAFHVHAKDFHWKSGMDVNPGAGWFQTRAGNYLRGAIIGHGEAKIYQSIQTLKKNGYDGYVTVEFEGMEDNLKGIELGLANLKRFIG